MRDEKVSSMPRVDRFVVVVSTLIPHSSQKPSLLVSAKFPKGLPNEKGERRKEKGKSKLPEKRAAYFFLIPFYFFLARNNSRRSQDRA
jgi:hypothetical protein